MKQIVVKLNDGSEITYNDVPDETGDKNFGDFEKVLADGGLVLRTKSADGIEMLVPTANITFIAMRLAPEGK